jgi:hypothetical protein
MEEIILRIEEKQFPAGGTYGDFYLGKVKVGSASKTPDGWVPFGKRKPLSDVMAAKAMIDSMISEARNDHKRAKRLLEDLRLHNGGKLPAAGG